MEGPVFIEHISPHFSLSSALTQVYHRSQSSFQSIYIVDTIPWGRCLILDGHMQSTERDEFIYHENIVHPAMLTHANPKKVFIGGGGEGATLREVLRHKSVERVVMVDIDEECVQVSKKYLSCHHQGSFEDPRVELVFDDAKAYLERSQEKFDVILQDLCDPVEGTPAKLLYTKKYFEMCKQKLNEGGIMCTQAGPAGLMTHKQVFSAIHHTMASVFPSVVAWSALVPSFADHWGWVIGSTRRDYDVLGFSEEEMERRLQQRLVSAEVLKYYDAQLHKGGLFSLPKCIREALKQEDRIITEEEPLVIP